VNNLFQDLGWLQAAPADFSHRLASVNAGNDLRALAQYALDDNQLRKLAKKYSKLLSENAELSGLTPMTLGVISNSTTQLMTPALQASALRFGIALKIVEAQYDQLAYEAYSAESAFAGCSVNMVLVAADYHGLPLKPCPGDREAAEKNVAECLAYLQAVTHALRLKTGAQMILQNIAPPVELLSGSFEGRLPGTTSWLLQRLNNELDQLVADDLFIFDVAGLASTVGLANWHDPTLYNIGKLPFAQAYTPIYADYFCRLLAARLGKSRRCLILDLDNTLWGGVIGDDGLEGILIGNGNPTGEAHLQLQQTILALRARGVVLAVSSKNEDAMARLPFKEHPDMVLKEDHIAVFQANWSDKASNIRAIAQTLSLGLESMVFLDDNPVERLQVRRELPEVAVPELPDDPALYTRVLAAAGYFEAITFSDEDRKRAAFYQDNAKRVEILSQSSDMEAYLKALEMEITLTPFDSVGRARIAQLISKSNQFNLTTKRYSEAEVKVFESDPNYFTRQVRLKDSMGDNGMICVLICKKADDDWIIDTWLMSCRVLGRKVEDAVLQDLLAAAKSADVSRVLGRYCPTGRNVIVKDHYKKLGFDRIRSDEHEEIWQLNVCDYQAQPLPMKFKYSL
jgi:FkbH-like protein